MRTALPNHLATYCAPKTLAGLVLWLAASFNVGCGTSNLPPAELAEKLLFNSRYEKAIETAEAALATETDEDKQLDLRMVIGQSNFNLAHQAEESGDAEQAKAYAQSAVDQFSIVLEQREGYEAYDFRSMSYAILGQEDAAAADALRVRELDPSYQAAYSNSPPNKLSESARRLIAKAQQNESKPDTVELEGNYEKQKTPEGEVTEIVNEIEEAKKVEGVPVFSTNNDPKKSIASSSSGKPQTTFSAKRSNEEALLDFRNRISDQPLTTYDNSQPKLRKSIPQSAVSRNLSEPMDDQPDDDSQANNQPGDTSLGNRPNSRTSTSNLSDTENRPSASAPFYSPNDQFSQFPNSQFPNSVGPQIPMRYGVSSLPTPTTGIIGPQPKYQNLFPNVPTTGHSLPAASLNNLPELPGQAALGATYQPNKMGNGLNYTGALPYTQRRKLGVSGEKVTVPYSQPTALPGTLPGPAPPTPLTPSSFPAQLPK